MKICLICAPGGHLKELLQLYPIIKKYNHFLITYDERFDNFMGIKRVYLLKNILISKINSRFFLKFFYFVIQMVLLTWDEVRIFLKEKPDVIISTGSEIAIPIFYLGKIFGKKVIFLESVSRLKQLSMTGKVIYPISDIFLVSWETLLKKYKKAQYRGNILLSSLYKRKDKKSENSIIFVTIGTAQFPRLVKKMDDLALLYNNIIIQTARTQYIPKNAKHFNFKENSEIQELCSNAMIIVTHAGIGSVLNAIESGTPFIVVPRLKKYRECIDDHQYDLAHYFENNNIAPVAYDVNKIPSLINEINNHFNTRSEKFDECSLNSFIDTLLLEENEKLNAINR